MDEIIVLSHGRVADRGTHAELLARPSSHRSLWNPGHDAEVAFPALLG
ncbi:hypothetical protein [Actinomadura sp. DC4]|nr:hypothetical protein [Actinomadura sp. DC4]MDN3354245.1 hypothetical protein [Actinomadura sp. DC4]